MRKGVLEQVHGSSMLIHGGKAMRLAAAAALIRTVLRSDLVESHTGQVPMHLSHYLVVGASHVVIPCKPLLMLDSGQLSFDRMRLTRVHHVLTESRGIVTVLFDDLRAFNSHRVVGKLDGYSSVSIYRGWVEPDLLEHGSEVLFEMRELLI